ncbi:MAG: cytochrome c biogenesis protein CcdA, partial [Blastocatellia bacterium]
MSGFASILQEYLSSGSLMAYPVAFIAGLLISFTPCVYPVIPIQLGFIGGQAASLQAGGGRASWRGFTLSVVFVTGMAIVYAALGAFASLTGALFGIWASSPWTYIAVGNVILLLALSMLDVI